MTRFATHDAQSATQLLGLLIDAAAEVAAEPGLEDYDVCVDVEDASVVWAVERWASAEHARAHVEATAARGAAEKVGPLLRAELTTAHLPVVLSVPPNPPGDRRPSANPRTRTSP
ncbi:antibiotic biosynthesis monooxygenase family protein [Pseudonocardia nematodicida]|uniref:Antibiotic biosynthesis monooxygenase family protein n=1 Tax=Pseudonocardia nematodicida TaxID=1206997 RepID=A0ABV1KHL3_9PSEU